MTQILVFGDSNTWGAWDREKGGWVNRLRLFLDREGDDVFLYNLGISDNTTQDVLGRFEFETKQRMKEDPDLVIIFDIGSNDSQFLTPRPRVLWLLSH
jgi:lysophospholipase L1-like esterase